MNSITSYSNQIAAQPSAAQNALPAVITAPEQAPQQVVRSDAEVVSNVASTEIKPSNVSQAAQPSQEVVAKTAQQLESFVQSMGRDLSFSVDSTTGYHVVRVTNPQTGEVVRQLPSEELLKIAETMQQNGNSGLVNQKA
jgi:flagellar protein FlaG